MDWANEQLNSTQSPEKATEFVKLIKECEFLGIECRPIVAGNFTKQPVIKRLNHSIKGELLNAERIDELGIFFGNDSRDLKKQIKKLGEIL